MLSEDTPLLPPQTMEGNAHDAMPSTVKTLTGQATLAHELGARGLQVIDSGGNGHCLFLSVIASILRADFLPVGSSLRPLLSRNNGCAALRQAIANAFMHHSDRVHYQDNMSDEAWGGYVRSIQHNGPGDERCIFAIAEIFKCNV